MCYVHNQWYVISCATLYVRFLFCKNILDPELSALATGLAGLADGYVRYKMEICFSCKTCHFAVTRLE